MAPSVEIGNMPNELLSRSSSVDCQVEKEAWFSSDEYQTRLGKVRASMTARGLDGLIVFSPANIFYLTGHHSIDSWEFRAAVISHDRPPEVLLFHFERGRFMASSWLDEARYYGPGNDPIAMLVSMIRERGLEAAVLGIEVNTPVLSVEAKHQLTEELSSAKWVNVARLIDDIRLCKSAEEMTVIERAALMTELGMHAAVSAAEVTASDCEVAAAATHAMISAGSHSLVMMPTVAVGQRSGLAHSEHIGRKIQSGDSVFLEMSACWRHYSAPLMKTVFVGQTDSRQEKMLEVAWDTAETIVQTAKVGVPACEIARAAHDTMRFIENEVQYHYNFGYSVGISYPPHWLEDSAFYLTEANPRPLQAGMVFHLPLTFRILGQCAAGMSHTIAVTEDGVRILTGAER